MAAQAHGQGERVEVAAILIRALAVGALAGLVLVIGQGWLLRAAWHLAPASAEVEHLAGR